MLAALLVPAVSQAQTFTFTAIPDEDETRLVQRFTQVADYLKGKVGVDVKYIPVKSYEAAVTAFRNNQVQLAWFGGLSGVQARLLVPGAQALAQGVEDTKFKSYFIAHVSTGLDKMDKLGPALAGKSFTFGSKGSTSGRLMPEFYLREAYGKSPEEVFSRVGFSGDHSKTIDLVESGAYEIGALNYEVWETEVSKGLVDTSKVKVIWVTPTYQDYQWTARGDLDKTYGAGFTAKLKAALVDLKDPAILKAFPRSEFIPASNDDYKAIAETARKIGLID
ncbi:MAG: putative selenate ABC transporter substrate-binding protein [Alphaproteobacteria bacterium]